MCNVQCAMSCLPKFVLHPPVRRASGSPGHDVEKLLPLQIRGVKPANQSRQRSKRLCSPSRRPSYPSAWPGNVRELSHELERAVVFEESDQLNFNHLLSSGGEGTPSDPRDWLNAKFAFSSQGFSLEDAINRLIQLALKQTGNNVSAAARLLGVSRDYVRYRLSGGKSSERSGPE